VAWGTMDKVPIEQAIEQKEKEGYDEGLKILKNEASEKYESSDEITKQEIQNRSQYTSTLNILTNHKYLTLNRVQQDCLKSKISFEPTPSLYFSPKIDVKKIDIKSTIDAVKNTNAKDLVNKNVLKDQINTKTIGNTVFKGKDGKKYVLVPAWSGNDPLNILNKNKGEGITKEGAAIVLPPYEDIKLGTTKYDFISLKEFADNYIDCSK